MKFLCKNFIRLQNIIRLDINSKDLSSYITELSKNLVFLPKLEELDVGSI